MGFSGWTRFWRVELPLAGPVLLAGIRVVDLTRMLAGPYATMLLADMGAEVIKVEDPAGDPIRGMGPPFEADGSSAYFNAINRNKKSVVLDLRGDADRARFVEPRCVAPVAEHIEHAGLAVEDRLGEIKFLIVYFAAGIAGSLLQVAIAPTSTVPMLGASGAISGILAAYVVYFPRARVLTFIVPFFFFTLSAYVFIGYWIALNALQAFLNIGVQGGGVAFFAHIGGFATGLILALLLRPREHPDPHPGYGVYP